MTGESGWNPNLAKVRSFASRCPPIRCLAGTAPSPARPPVAPLYSSGKHEEARSKSRRIVHRNSKPFPEHIERLLNQISLRIVLRVQHSPDDRLIAPQSPGEFHVTEP